MKEPRAFGARKALNTGALVAGSPLDDVMHGPNLWLGRRHADALKRGHQYLCKLVQLLLAFPASTTNQPAPSGDAT